MPDINKYKNSFNIRRFVITAFFALVNANFIYSQSITVISPSSGEELTANSFYEIKWLSDGVQSVKIEYSKNNGIDWELITASFPAVVQKYSLVIPDSLYDTLLVKISDTSNNLVSDSNVALISTIVSSSKNQDKTSLSGSANSNPNSPTATLTLVSPNPASNGGIVWERGTNPTITWTFSNLSTIDIEYSIDGGNNWLPIATGVPTTPASYSAWTVPNTPSSEVVIKISGGSTTDKNAKFVFIKAPQFNPSSTIKVLPVGNSITYDSFRAEFRIPQNKISYRYNLWDLLRTNNYNTDFIGHKLGGYALFPDPESDGSPGISDFQMSNFLLTGQDPTTGDQVTPGNYLEIYNPDVVLVHIGTNGVDVDQSSTDIQNILNTIDNFEVAKSKVIWVVLALIIDDADATTPFPNPFVTAFNNNIKAMAETRINSGDKIIILDMQNDAGLTYVKDKIDPYSTGDMYDELHPNNSGKKKMANLWYRGLQLILPNSVMENPVITSSPVTTAYVGLPYRYNVDASGVGAPNYSLTTFPPNMTINSKTGIIDWPSPSGSSVNVSVTATHPTLFTTDVQTFTINILPAPSLPANIISYWRLDETGTPSSYEDLSGINDAYPIDAPSSVTGIAGNALSFNGTANKVYALDDSTFYFYPWQDFTLETWVKTTKSGVAEVFLGKDGGYANFYLGTNTSNQTTFVIVDSVGATIPVFGPAINDGKWHHVAGNTDRTNSRLNIYVDGKRSFADWTFSSSGFFSHDPLTMGNYRYGYFYDGLLDEVAIYNRKVPGFELARHYISGLARKGYSDNYVLVSAKAFLQGPYNSGTGLMDTTLKANNSIPKTLNPYTAAPWNYNGLERVDSYPDSVVDWVLVELRDPVDPTIVISKRAAFIKKNGNLVDIDPDNDMGWSPADTTGLNYIIFPGVSPGNYYITIKHRNHLGIMSKMPVSLSKAPTLYDFSTGSDKFYGGSAGALQIDTSPIRWGMIAGDANSDGSVDAVDKNNFWRVENGTPWTYSKNSDFNLDGNLDAVDKNSYWRPNNGKSTQVRP